MLTFKQIEDHFGPTICNIEAKKATAWSPLRSPDPDGGRGGMQYLAAEFFPVNAPAHLTVVWSGAIKPTQWPELVEKCKTGSLRRIARQYGVSHEAVGRILQRTSVLDLV